MISSRTLSAPTYPAGILLCFLLACARTGTPPAALSPAPSQEEDEARQQVFREQHLQQSRLDDIAYPILAAATPLCTGDRRPQLGARVATIHSYPPELQPAAAQALELGDTLTVLSVTYGAPAATGGIRSGDRIIGLDETPIPPGPEAVSRFMSLLSTHTKGGDPELSVSLVREGERSQARIRLEQVCDYESDVVENGDVNAVADGRKIFVTSAMMRFVSNDELRVVVAHEFAHNALGHPERKNALAGVLTADFERQADYVGLYALRLAEIPLETAPAFWRRVAQLDPRRISFARAHPITAERFDRMGQAIAEIRQKGATRVAMLPTSPTALNARSSNPLTQQIDVQPKAAVPADDRDAPGGSGIPKGKARKISANSPEVRAAIRDLVRLGMVNEVEEVRPGLLRLTVGDGFMEGSALEFQLGLLYTPYAEGYGDDATLELFRGRVKIGEYTQDGLILAAHEGPATP